MKNKFLVLTFFSLSFCFFKSSHIAMCAEYNTLLMEHSTCPISKSINVGTELQHTINLFWINRELELDQIYIFPNKDEAKLITYFETIADWAQKNPADTLIQVWYDGNLIPEDAVDNTNKLINQTTSHLPSVAPIILRDVRSLPFVQKHPCVLDTQLDVYFRADLLRLIVSINDIIEGRAYSMYADLDMPPITYGEIYDEETLKKLESYGIVLTEEKSTFRGFENNFHIISYHNTNLLEAIQLVLIDLNTERAKNLLQTLLNYDRAVLRQIIFENYTLMFRYFCYLEGILELKVLDANEEDTGELYDRRRHGLSVFCTFGENDINKYDYETPLWKGRLKSKERSCPAHPVKTVNMPKANSQNLS